MYLLGQGNIALNFEWLWFSVTHWVKRVIFWIQDGDQPYMCMRASISRLFFSYYADLVN